MNDFTFLDDEDNHIDISSHEIYTYILSQEEENPVLKILLYDNSFFILKNIDKINLFLQNYHKRF